MSRGERSYLFLSIANSQSTFVTSSTQGLFSLPDFLPKCAQICSLIVENSFRILSSPSFIVPSSSPKGRVDLSTHIHPTDDQFYEEIISWTIFACRNVPRGFLGEYLPFILSFICKFITDGISRAKLISECTILLLINVDGNGSVAHPEVLFQTLGHPVISTLFLIDSGTSTDVSSGHCFRERFITALCRAIIKMLPITVAYALSTDGTLRNNTIKPDDSFGDSVVNLTPSKVDHHHHATGGDRKPFAGIGCFAELFGTTLRSSGHTTNELNSFSVSADLALQQIDNLVACALFVLRSSHK